MKNFFAFIQKIKTGINCRLFPVFCLSCRREGEWLCENCLRKLQIKNYSFCPFCRSLNNNASVCFSCVPHSFLDSLCFVFPYRAGSAGARLIEDFKYNFAEELKIEIKKILEIWDGFNGKAHDYVLVPVPLHQKRLAERGFNQSFEIASILSFKFSFPLSNDILIRSINTRQQAKLNKVDRTKNVAGAFTVKNPQLVKNKKIILVDDVFTTGATMQECAKALKAAGALRVEGFTLSTAF